MRQYSSDAGKEWVKEKKIDCSIVTVSLGKKKNLDHSVVKQVWRERKNSSSEKSIRAEISIIYIY